jgi:hypothetical protein
MNEKNPGWRTLVVAVALFANCVIAEAKMERVTGIGGFFFRSENPQALAKWYLDNLGINPAPADYTKQPWIQEKGATVFAPFPKEAPDWSKARPWMLNFRVRNLDAMVAQLRQNGIQVEVDPETYPNGRFAGLKDPEGNPLQLWEPK